MPVRTNLISALTSPSLSFARRLFHRPAPPLLTDPLHSRVPALRHAEIAAIYQGLRVAGDFYEFLRASPSRVLFGLSDIAGRREDTREILIGAQKTFRTVAPELFRGEDINEPVAMIELSQQLNRTILRCAGVRSCPAFIGCYNEDLGTVCYANAGHTPALLRDQTGITPLEATGLPLGLFSHTTRSASTCDARCGSSGRIPRICGNGMRGRRIRIGRHEKQPARGSRIQCARTLPDHSARGATICADRSHA